MWSKRIKGMVAETCGDDLILLTREGQFVRLPAQEGDHCPGMEVEVRLPGQWKRPLMLAVAGVAAAMLIIFFHLIPVSVPAPAAYLALDINPSLVLSLDENAIVMEVEALNEDAERILNQLQLEELEVQNALHIILDAAHEGAYLRPGRDHVVLISLAAPERYIVGEDDLRASVTRQLDELQVDTYLRITVTGIEKMKQAQELMTSLNALMLAEELSTRVKGGMAAEDDQSFLEGPPSSVRELLQAIDLPVLFCEDEFIAPEKGPLEEKLPPRRPLVPDAPAEQPPDDGRGSKQVPADEVDVDKPVEVPRPPSPDKERRPAGG